MLGTIVISNRWELLIWKMGDFICFPDDVVEESVDGHGQDRRSLLGVHFLGRFLSSDVTTSLPDGIIFAHLRIDGNVLSRHHKRNHDSGKGQHADLCPQKGRF